MLKNLSRSKIYFNLKFQLKHLTNTSRYISEKETDDEVGDINELLHKNLLGEKKSLKLDVYKDLKKFNEFKNKEKQIKTDEIIKNKISKLSLSEQVSLRQEEDVNNYNLIIQSTKDSEELIESIFKKGVNENFFKNIDKVYEVVKNEEINKWEEYGKAENIYEVKEVEKDLSDIEKEIENVENFFLTKINAQSKEVKQIPEFVKKETNETKSIEEYIQINSKSTYKDKYEFPKKSNNEHKLKTNNSEIKLRINWETNSNIAIKNSSSTNYSSININTNYENPVKRENIKKPEIDYSLLLNPNPLQDFIFKNNTIIDKQEVNSIDKVEKSKKIEKKSNNEFGIKTTLKKRIPILNMETIKKFKISSNQNNFIQKDFINLSYQNLSNLFENISGNLYEKSEVFSKKSNKTYIRTKLKDNLNRYLVDNYKIKQMSEKVKISLFKKLICELDKRRLELIFGKISESKTDNIIILYNSKRDENSEEGYCVFLIFAENNHLASLITNIGVIQNIQILNYFCSFLSLMLVELIQNNCQNKNSNLLRFNLLLGKKFYLENKLSQQTKNHMTKILIKLIDGKLSNFNMLTNRENISSDFDDVLNEEGLLLKKSELYKMPNLKFHSYSNLLKKQFSEYFSMAAELECGSLCFKI